MGVRADARPATRWRHLRGALYRGELGAERRTAVRVPAGQAEVRAEASGARGRPAVAAGQPGQAGGGPERALGKAGALRLWDISATGCAYLCDDTDAPPVGTILDLLLVGDGASLPIRGRVVHAAQVRGSQDS